MKSREPQIPVVVGTSETGTVDEMGTWGKVVGFQPFLCHDFVTHCDCCDSFECEQCQARTLFWILSVPRAVVAPEAGRDPWMSLHPLDLPCLAWVLCLEPPVQ